MQKTAPVSSTSVSLALADVQDLTQAWIDDGEVRQFSGRTIDERQRVTGKLLWFRKDRELPLCGPRDLPAFLAYVSHGDERGRWGTTSVPGPLSQPPSKPTTGYSAPSSTGSSKREPLKSRQ